jgi:hypothetical protein
VLRRQACKLLPVRVQRILCCGARCASCCQVLAAWQIANAAQRALYALCVLCTL